MTPTEEYIQKQFVTDEIAARLRKLGYDKPLVVFAHPNGILWQEARDWFQERHHLIIEVSYDFAGSKSFNVSLIQEGEKPLYHATDIINEPDYFIARKRGIEEALTLLEAGTLDYLAFESWFTQALELWANSGLLQKIQLDKATAKIHYEAGQSPEAFIQTSLSNFK